MSMAREMVEDSNSDEQECPPRPEKKQKLTMAEAEAKSDDQSYSDDEKNDDDDDDDDVEEEDDDDDEEIDMSKLAPPPGYYDDEDWSDDITEEILKRYEPYEDAPPILHSDPTPLDISGALFNIIDPEKETDAYDIRFFYDFMDMCHRKKNLLIFDHPGDPRIGGLGRMEGEWANHPSNINLAQTAIKEYCKLNTNANLELQEVKCVNECLLHSRVLYLTFMAKDKNTNMINKYQAALWNDVRRYELGLLRDASNDKVLAILKVKGATGDATASEGGSAVSAAAPAPDNLGEAKE